MGCSPWGLEDSDTTEQLHFHFSLSCIGGGNGNPLQCSCLENPRDGRAWWAAVYGVTQSQTRLKRLSNSSNTRKNSPRYVPIPSFSYLISCCFSEHTVISAVLQTSQPSLPLFHCLCASVTKNNPLRKKPTALKFYFSFHANIKRWLLHKLTLMLPT